MNVDGFGGGRKTRLPDFELIDAVRQALHVEAALIAGRQCISIPIRLADDLNRGSNAKTVGIGHSKAQLAAIALAVERHRAKEKNSCKSRHEESAFVV
jgi:hypothetical protein